MSVLTEGKWAQTHSETAAVFGNNMTLFATAFLHFPSSPSSSSSFKPRWRRSISGATEPVPALEGLLMGPAKFPFDGVHPEDFTSQSTTWFYWNMSTTTCKGHIGPTACTACGFHCCFHGRLLPVAFHSFYWSQSIPHIIHSDKWLRLWGYIGHFSYCTCGKIMDLHDILMGRMIL